MLHLGKIAIQNMLCSNATHVDPIYIGC